MPHPSQTGKPSQTSDDWWINDQTPDNPYGKSEDYESFIDHLGSLPSWLTPEIAAGTVRINLYELNNHPEYKAAAIGALEMWASVTPLKFEIIDDAPFDGTTDQIEVVSPELGEEDDGMAYSNGHHVSIGQGFDDKEAHKTDVGGYVFQAFMHEFGHQFGLNHPGDYNYSGPDGASRSPIGTMRPGYMIGGNTASCPISIATLSAKPASGLRRRRLWPTSRPSFAAFFQPLTRMECAPTSTSTSTQRTISTASGAHSVATS
ncbi:hypothetical protein GGD54_006067 [Rhizobium tropici]|uniref:Peptidase metallopeptidase domain-containing protein n=1 Tax=Rhizobium tropici TaxID=398 RepID=A0ABR6R8W5_RHITR|nr:MULTISPECIES: matrixin family metalloprotease [Rhizobium]MBB4245278.1 hypothetical protein [Rhizobium tropici]MBB5596638.1 hypothetical protein [Rhizobium tropici]MBB6495614.1 hypothetical protein [Rhizobium tropici]MDK4741482.1 hypothetical protein [Rhizobium sp. CNPSo 3464]